jgi:argininosuccinate lyase
MGTKTSSKKSKALWGGRFAAEAHNLVQELGKSVHFDRHLYREDIAGSRAHARMLKKIGILSAGEWSAIDRHLAGILAEIESGKFVWQDRLEDVHMNIESALTARTPAGARLHTGRSRNDQVATDVRLWLKARTEEDVEDVARLQSALVRFAADNVDVLIPGYTHLQRAQPVYLAHHLLAYVEMLERDKGRFQDALKRLDRLPLGSGALAGSTIPLDREFVARELGFAGVTQNSLDAVSDRDFIVEYAAAAALLAVHLSRLAEDVILWSTTEFGFIRIGDAFTTGSSLMPQKKNPDVAELTRGKSGRVIGNLVSLLVLLKGLPMTYNRDLQEDKERLFDTADTIRLTLRVNAAMFGDIRVNRDACTRAVADPNLLATDIADALVLRGVPFRHAHEVVGRAVALAEHKKTTIADLSLADWKTIHPKVDASVLAVFDPVAALDRRIMTGAPGRKQVAAQLKRWKKILGR